MNKALKNQEKLLKFSNIAVVAALLCHFTLILGA